MKPVALQILESGPGNPDWNMAVDEALLLTAASRGLPVLRFYAWTLPAATFGYFQRLAEVQARTHLRPLVRRPTGGGIVPHDRDWTYSLAVPPGHPWHRLRAIESYRAIHEWVIRALAQCSLPAELAPCCRKEAPGACFEGYEKFDVLRLGRKIAGAAQRRNQNGLLIQGSVQPPPAASRKAWELAMANHPPQDLLPGQITPFTPDEPLLAQAQDLARNRYANPTYTALR